ncbi:MAG TPA: acyltransferase family protein [Bryobacteraceae bacterium]|nr:acyltransferase family protein [Bryobacteraceae bacterium]
MSNAIFTEHMRAGGRIETSGYRPEIDGLRALAVIAVIINHFNTALLLSGHLGVDIFFVISGYVITASLANRSDKRFTAFLREFYARRLKRLAPALAVCVVLTGTLICLVDYSPSLSHATGLTALFGWSNIYLLSQSTDYFAVPTELNAFTQTWSLGVEEQFYLVFPALLWITGFSRQTPHGRKLILLAMAALSAASVWAFVAMSKTNPPAAYFLMPTRLWELATGCLVYSGWPLLAKTGITKTPIADAAIVLLIAGLFAPPTVTIYATTGVVLLTAVLIASLRPGSATYGLLAHPVSQNIGLISYSLYLWHWSVLSLSRWTVGIHWWSAPFQIGLILIASIASYRYIERPLRHAKWSAQSWKSIAYGVAGLSCAGGVVFLVHTYSAALFIRNYNLIVLPEYEPLIGSHRPFDPTCVVDGAGRVLQSNTFELCTVGPKKKDGQMLFALGDSHAGALQSLFYAVHEQLGLGVHLVETPGFPFPMNSNAALPARKILYDRIAQTIRPDDIILLSRLYLDRASPHAPLDTLDSWYADVEKLAESLALKKVQLVIVGPPPIFEFDNIGVCRSPSGGNNVCGVPRAPLAAKIGVVQNSLESLASRCHNVHVYEPFSVLCPEQDTMCVPAKEGIALFRDSDHLNSFGARSLAPDFTRFLLQNGLIRNGT